MIKQVLIIATSVMKRVGGICIVLSVKIQIDGSK